MKRNQLQIAMALILALNSSVTMAAPDSDTDDNSTSQGTVAGRQKKEVLRILEDVTKTETELLAIQKKIDGMGELATVEAWESKPWVSLTPNSALASYVVSKYTKANLPASVSPTSVILLAPQNEGEQAVIDRIKGTEDSIWKCVSESLKMVQTFRTEQSGDMSPEQKLVRLVKEVTRYNELMVTIQKSLSYLSIYQDDSLAQVTKRINDLHKWRVEKNIWLVVTTTRNISQRCASGAPAALVASSQVMYFNVAQPTNLLDWNKKLPIQARQNINQELTKAQRDLYRSSLALSFMSAQFPTELKAIADKINQVPRPAERLRSEPVYRPEKYWKMNKDAITYGAAGIAGTVSAFYIGRWMLRTNRLTETTASGLGNTLLPIAFVVSGFSIFIGLMGDHKTRQIRERDRTFDNAPEHLARLRILLQNDAEFHKMIAAVAADWSAILGLDSARQAQLVEALRNQLQANLAYTSIDNVWNGKVEMKINAVEILAALGLMNGTEMKALREIDEQANQVGAQLNNSAQVTIEETLRLNVFQMKSMLEIYQDLASNATGDLAAKLEARIANLRRAVKNAEETLKLVELY